LVALGFRACSDFCSREFLAGTGAPGIHGELLKVGIEISQATVAKYMARRVGTPSPTWRTFLRKSGLGHHRYRHVRRGVRVVLLYLMVILGHDRRKIVRFDVIQHPTAEWLSQQITEALP
jgi:putative transposase